MVRSAFDELIDSIDALSPAERIARLTEVEQTIRRLEAETAVLVRALERDRAFRSDGHLSVGGFLRGELRWSPQQVTNRRSPRQPRQRSPRSDPTPARRGDRRRAGRRVRPRRRQPRCGGQLADHTDVLLDAARSLSFEGFHTAIVTRERLADADGANREAEANHANRNLSFTHLLGVGHLGGQCGALDYVELSEILEQYRHAEFLADWEWATAIYGADVAGSMLPGTNAQRSWDALMRMARDAVSTPAGAQPPEPVVNISMSTTHAEAALAALGLIPESTTAAGAPSQPLDEWCCETTNGTPLSPFEVAQAMLHGRLRRVVFDSAGVVTDFGRLQRLFDGAARKAVLLQFPTCVFPGCNRPSSQCEADHLTDWRHGGGTDQANGAPLCPRHNQLKNHGFTVWRDPNGVFHTYRPDGAELGPPPPPPGTSPPTIPKAA